MINYSLYSLHLRMNLLIFLSIQNSSYVEDVGTFNSIQVFIEWLCGWISYHFIACDSYNVIYNKYECYNS